jgi:hypothetical protein
LQAKKYQVFVSSTYSDLIEERREVIEAIIDLGHIPAGMEGFPAIDIEQFNYIKKVIDQCDYYIIIVAGRYGSVADDGVSFTEKEYRYAVDTGKVVIGFVIDETAGAKLPDDRIEIDPKVQARLKALRADVMKGRLIRAYTDRNSLAKAVMKALVAAFDEFPREGWVRASGAANEDILSQINELRIKNEALRAENEGLQRQLLPDIDNLASLESLYELKYIYYGNRGREALASIKLSWLHIFTGIAPRLTTPQSPRRLAGYLDGYLMSSGRLHGLVVKSINPISVDQIRFQLGAYGLIKEIRGTDTSGGLGEWLQITELGERVMMEAVVVKDVSTVTGV